MKNTKEEINDSICWTQREVIISTNSLKESRELQKIINEALNIFNETGFTPRQLADQKAQLLKFALKFSEQLASGKIDVLSAKDGYGKEVADMIRLNIKAIKNATKL